MKYLKQLSIILLISLIGEALSFFIPLPIPASIYGIVLLFALLCAGIVHVEDIKEVSAFLIEIMTVMFIPATVGLMDAYDLLAPSLGAYVVIMVVSTFAVMFVSGRAAQHIIQKRSRKEEPHA